MENDQDFNIAIGWNRITLGILGIWPDPFSPEELTTFEKYRFLIPAVLMLAPAIIPQLVNLVFIWGDLDLMCENFSTASIPGVNSIAKLLFARYHRKALRLLLKSFTEDWNVRFTSEERAVMLKNAKFAKNICVWCTVVTQTMVTLYLLSRIIAVSRVNIEEIDQDHLLLYPGYVPFDMRSTKAIAILAVAQVFGAYSATSAYTSVDSFISMLILHACAQFSIVSMRLERLFDEDNRNRSAKEFRNEMEWIVEKHDYLNRFVTTIEKSFNWLLLLQMILCTIQLCFQGFQFFTFIAVDDKGELVIRILFFIFFVSFIVGHVYLYCYVGEILIVQSTKMAESAYNSKWYNTRATEARPLTFVMCRSAIPLRLTAGKFGAFSMEMFSTILRTAMGYLSVLFTVSSHD